MWCRGEAPYVDSPTLRIDLVVGRIHRCGRTLALSRRQFRLLKILLDADGRVLTHRDLIDATWESGERGSVALLRKVIQDLRRKIEIDPKQPMHILSHSRIGYRFDGSVTPRASRGG
jgi:two-component system KDP operon response regulator KdpE